MISVHNSRVIARYLVRRGIVLDKGSEEGLYITVSKSYREDPEFEKNIREFQYIWFIASLLGGRVYVPRVHVRVAGENKETAP